MPSLYSVVNSKPKAIDEHSHTPRSKSDLNGCIFQQENNLATL